jgi:serine/threonine protein kinase
MIGQGAYGIVYKGRKEDTNEIVAIKRIPFADSTPEGGVPCNVIREISLLRELDHPNVVKLFDIIQAGSGGLYLIFEYVAHDLKTYMDQHQKTTEGTERIGLPLPTTRSFLKQILSGVGCCHTYRILHRDLKPHNVRDALSLCCLNTRCVEFVVDVDVLPLKQELGRSRAFRRPCYCHFLTAWPHSPLILVHPQLLISHDGKHVKLADFGLARLSAIPNGPYTFEVVTLWYRAPELLLGANRYSTSVDVWSVGCIFAEMATGVPLFPGRSDIDQIFRIFQRRGTPSAEAWPGVLHLPHYNPEFPSWRERPITDFVPLHTVGGHAGCDLLNKLLQYDPHRRIACKTALQHPFFMQE